MSNKQNGTADPTTVSELDQIQRSNYKATAMAGILGKHFRSTSLGQAEHTHSKSNKQMLALSSLIWKPTVQSPPSRAERDRSLDQVIFHWHKSSKAERLDESLSIPTDADFVNPATNSRDSPNHLQHPNRSTRTPQAGAWEGKAETRRDERVCEWLT